MAQPQSQNLDSKVDKTQQNRQAEEHEQSRQSGQRGASERGDDGRDRQAQVRNSINGSTNLFTTATLRGIGQLIELQAASARSMLRFQLRAAAAFGLPDYSRVFTVDDDRVLRLFSIATDNMVRFGNEFEAMSSESQSHFLRLFEQQASELAERWYHSLEELQQQTEDGLQQFKAFSRQQAEGMARASESLSEATRATLREGGEQLRATVRQSMEQGRDIAERQIDVINDAGEIMGASMRDMRRGNRSADGEHDADERQSRRASRGA